MCAYILKYSPQITRWSPWGGWRFWCGAGTAGYREGGFSTGLRVVGATDCFSSTRGLKTSSISSSVYWASALCACASIALLAGIIFWSMDSIFCILQLFARGRPALYRFTLRTACLHSAVTVFVPLLHFLSSRIYFINNQLTTWRRIFHLINKFLAF
jgi:hypothetical protein